MSRRSDLGGGVSLDASRVIERPLLRFGTSFARRRVSGVARAVAARSSNARVRMLAAACLVELVLQLRVHRAIAVGCGDA